MAINLLPWREQIYQKHQQVFSRIFLSMFMLLMGSIAISTFYVSHSTRKATTQHKKLSDEIQGLRQNQPLSEKMEEDQRNHRYWILEIFRKQQNIPKFLSYLSEVEYQGFYLTQITYEKGKIHLRGRALSLLRAFNFIRQLSLLTIISEVRFLSAEDILKQKLSLGRPGAEKSFTVGIHLK